MLTFFTVVITTKNRPAYAAEAITSVIDQTEPAVNIVVVGDGNELPAA
jgi:glycosyltransferase involved in cell wall biosynthesis